MVLRLLILTAIVIGGIPTWAGLSEQEISDITELTLNSKNSMVQAFTDCFEQEAAELSDSNPDMWKGTAAMDMARFYRKEAMEANMSKMKGLAGRIAVIQEEVGTSQDDSQGRIKALGQYEDMALRLIKTAASLDNQPSGFATSNKILSLVERLKEEAELLR